MSKLNLDRDKIDECRQLAETAIHPIQKYIDFHSSVGIERAVLRLLGLSAGQSLEGISLTQKIVDHLDKNRLASGVAPWIAAAKIKMPEITLDEIAEQVDRGELNLNTLIEPSSDSAQKALQSFMTQTSREFDRNRKLREDKKIKYNRVWPPLRAVSLTWTNTEADITNAVNTAQSGADIVSFVAPLDRDEPIERGHLQAIRRALDGVSEDTNRYVRMSVDAMGPSMAEMAVLSSLEAIDFATNDPMTSLFLCDVNSKRAFIDQFFARQVLCRAGMVVQTSGEAGIPVPEAYCQHPLVLANQFINEQLCKNAGLREDQMGLTHLFGLDPKVADSFLFELAMGQLMRDVFGRHPIRMVPVRPQLDDSTYQHMSAALYDLCGVATDQQVQSVMGVSSMAQASPLEGALLGLKGANHVSNLAGSLYDEFQFNQNGKLVRRARTVLDATLALLEKVKAIGFIDALEQGTFGGMSKAREVGRGLDGVFQRSRRYFNPFLKKVAGR